MPSSTCSNLPHLVIFLNFSGFRVSNDIFILLIPRSTSGFANFFNQITFNDGVDLVALIGFSFGVETAQILIATSILILNSILFLINPGFRKNYVRLISIIVCLLTILIFI